MSAVLILLYLGAIAVANLAVGLLGPAALAVTAWILIPFDLTVKDALQEKWSGSGVALRLGALLLAGSALSAALSPAAGRVAVASFVAFAMAGTCDSLVLARLSTRGRMVRVNASNLAGAVVDSAVFQVIAFGTFDPWIFTWQTVAKLTGGFIWSAILIRTIWRQR